MNDESSKAPPIPPEHVRPLMAAKPLPLGENPADCVPIPGLVGAAEAILREPRRVLFHLRQGRAGVIAWMLVISVVCILVYGVIVGTFSGGAQLYFAPLKIALGMLVSTLICLPSLYIFACLGGSRARLAEVFGMVSGLLALMTVLLIGFAPRGLDFFAIDELGHRHGRTASAVLVRRRVLRTAIPRSWIFAYWRQLGRTQGLDRDLRPGLSANDDCVAPDCRHGEYVLPDREKVFPESLDRLGAGMIDARAVLRRAAVSREVVLTSARIASGMC